MKTDAASALDHARRILIIRLRSLGDCVLSTPAIQLVKEHRPHAEIAVLAESAWHGVFEHNPDITAILAPSPRAVRDFRPDVALDLHGGNTAAFLTLISGACYRAGFAHFKRRLAYNVLIPPAQEVTGQYRPFHTAEHLATAVFHLGVPQRTVPRARLFVSTTRPHRVPYAVIHAVAATPEKTWNPGKFLLVAGHLRDHHHLNTIFIGAAGDDLSPFTGWPSVRGAPLSELKTIIAGATLFVGNDSGPAHMAAALGVPPVVLFGPSDPLIWGPWRIHGEVVKSAGPISGIDVGQVTAAVDRVRVMA